MLKGKSNVLEFFDRQNKEVIGTADFSKIFKDPLVSVISYDMSIQNQNCQ